MNGDNPFGNNPFGNNPFGGSSNNSNNGNNSSNNDNPFGNNPFGNTNPFNDSTNNEQSNDNGSNNNQMNSSTNSDDNPFGNNPFGNNPFGNSNNQSSNSSNTTNNTNNNNNQNTNNNNNQNNNNSNSNNNQNTNNNNNQNTNNNNNQNTNNQNTENTNPTDPDNMEQDPEEALEELIGLGSVKKELQRIKAFAIKNKGKKLNIHMVFNGNPGTGKTVVARLLGKIFVKHGILPNTNFVEGSSDTLVSQYIGETAIKTKQAIDKAMGGVLFVDEAYTLNQGGENSHGKEAIAALLKGMEDHRGKFCCILAGYKKEMADLFDVNPGFKSRVQFFIEFPDYTRDELKQIAQMMLSKEEYIVDDKVLDRMMDIILLKKQYPNFANAREVRILIDKLAMVQSDRTINDISNREITMDDIKTYCEEENVVLPDDGNLDDYEEKLNELIGLSSVKDNLKLFIAYTTKNKDKKVNLHMVFNGNPGTGKTEVARLLGKILYKNNILPTDKFIETDCTGLIGEYIGSTAPKTKALVESALGGVLFIDEAYALSSGTDRNSFGKEAVAELLKQMEDHRGEFCCILAGYKKEMAELFQVNTGFKSRVQFFCDFPDYSIPELKEIAKLVLRKNKYTMDEDAMDLMMQAVSYKMTRPEPFANAREVRIILEQLEMIQSQRTIDELENRNITIEDVNRYLASINLKVNQQEDKNVQSFIPMVDYGMLNNLYDGLPQTDFATSRLDIEEAVVCMKATTPNGAGEGSGFIISPDGYYVTCAHCVSGATNISTRVRIKDRHGKSIDTYYDTTLIAIDQKVDLAICKIGKENETFCYVPLSKEGTADLEPLHKIILLGYPFGFSRFDTLSINEGKISSYQRNRADGGPDFVNLDLTAKSGNSGSCILDVETGRVIGVLCGSNLSRSGDLVEEVNYCRPFEYVWNLIKEHQNEEN